MFYKTSSEDFMSLQPTTHGSSHLQTKQQKSTFLEHEKKKITWTNTRMHKFSYLIVSKFLFVCSFILYMLFYRLFLSIYQNVIESIHFIMTSVIFTSIKTDNGQWSLEYDISMIYWHWQEFYVPVIFLFMLKNRIPKW